MRTRFLFGGLFLLAVVVLAGCEKTAKTEDESKRQPPGSTFGGKGTKQPTNPDAQANRQPSRTSDKQPKAGGTTVTPSGAKGGSPEVAETAQAIKKLGGGLILENKDNPESPIIGVRFSARITEDKLGLLKKIPTLRLIQIHNSGITGDQLGTLTKIPSLREVQLTLCYRLTDISTIAEIAELRVLSLEKSGQIKDAGLEPLTRLRKLEALTLPSSITDDGLRIVAGIQSLKRLDLKENQHVTDAGMSHVARMSGLTHLALCRKVGDAGLAKLANHPAMESLNLSKCHNITDSGLRPLATIPNLRELDLFGGQKLTDAGLDNLTAAKTLKKLRLPSRSRKIMDQGVIRLKKAIPGLEVVR